MTYLLRDLPFGELMRLRLALDAELLRRYWWLSLAVALCLLVVLAACRVGGHAEPRVYERPRLDTDPPTQREHGAACRVRAKGKRGE